MMKKKKNRSTNPPGIWFRDDVIADSLEARHAGASERFSSRTPAHSATQKFAQEAPGRDISVTNRGGNGFVRLQIPCSFHVYSTSSSSERELVVSKFQASRSFEITGK